MIAIWCFIIYAVAASNNSEISNKSFDKTYSNIEKHKNDTKRQLEEEENIRPISIIFDTKCLYDEIPDNFEELYNLYIKAINLSGEIIKKFIKVEKGNINTNDINLGKFFICANNSLYNKTLDADLLIFLRVSRQLENENSFFSSVVKYDEITQRPLVGKIIIDTTQKPIQLNSSDLYQIRNMTQIFLHTITHILGFSKSILESKNFILNKSKESRINIQNSSIKLIVNNSKIINLAKNYYNCDEIDGIELDSINNNLCNEIHWEGRLLLGDYMTSDIYYPEQVISEFTLTLLEELGWYKVDHYSGGLMKFGKNKGCNFINNDCVKINDNIVLSSFPNEFCSQDSISTCSSGRLSRGYCYNNKQTIIEGKTVVDEIYWRKDMNKGYGIKNVEYCPISLETKISNVNIYKGNCNFGNNRFGNELYGEYDTNSDYFGEFIGKSSFCALSSIIYNNSNINHDYQDKIRPTCYSMSCSDKSLTIELYSKTNEIEYIVCPREGGLIKIGGKHSYYNGYLFCPDYNLICSGSTLCNDLFDCIEKQSTSKDLSYDYSVNYISSEVREGNNTNQDLSQYSAIEGFEESLDGICPVNCSQCISNKRCTLCRNFNNSNKPPYAFYIGEKDDKESEINCTAIPPNGGYYNTTKYDNYIHYFRCVENCNVCQNASICDQCLPTHKIRKNDNSCVERIEHCLEYNESFYYFDSVENGGGKGYIECIHCDNNKHYFCEDMNKKSCTIINDYPSKKYYQMEDENFPCIQKCSKKFPNCLECEKNHCIKCEPKYFVNSTTGYCQERIPNCSEFNESSIFQDNINNGGGMGYKECSKCDNEHGYYCLNMNKEVCQYIPDYSEIMYKSMESGEAPCIYRYIEGCKEYTQNKSFCYICKPEYFVNKGYCEERIHHCIKYNESSAIEDHLYNNGGRGYTECEQCDNNSNYYCFNNNKSACQELNPEELHYYYEMTDDSYSCIRNCSLEYPYCLECNRTNCNKCSFEMRKNRSCFPPIYNCLEHEKYEINDVEYVKCLKCDQKNSYYCVNNKRNACDYIENTVNYFKIEDDEYSCIQKCEEKIDNCIKCNRTECFECDESYVLSNKNKTKCIPTIQFLRDDECKVFVHEIDTSINELDIGDFIEFYFSNTLPYLNHIDHFVNENYTATMFIYSECTEDLLDQGYYKINSTDLYNQMYNDAEIESNELLFSIFIKYNYQNYYIFYDFFSRPINETIICPKCFDIPYIVTNKYTNDVSNILGPFTSDLIELEKKNIFSNKSDIFTDLCTNVTLKGVDIPLDERLQYLYLDDYSNQIACTGKNCEIKQIYPEKSISVCECRLGNKFQDIKDPIITFSNNKKEISTPSNSIGESFSIIKCANKGMKKSNIIHNGGFYITIGATALTITCFIVYCLYSKVINLEKGASPPSKKIKNRIILDCDWQKQLRNISNNVETNFDNDLIQSRDEDENNYTEEDLTFTRKYDESSYSIDTEIGIKKNSEKDHDKDINDINKGLSEKKSRKILVLLSNKKKGKKRKDKSSETSEEFEFISTEEIKRKSQKNFCQIYWFVLSIKQHIINFFSSIKCCKITDTYIPLPIRFIRSLFLVVLSLLLNALFLTQYYFSEKFKHFNGEYKLIVTNTDEMTVGLNEIINGNIPTKELWKYAFHHTYIKAIIVFVVLIVIQFLIGIIFFSLRSSVLATIRSNDLNDIKNLINKARIKYIVFFILCLILLIVFLFSFIGFGGAYGGAFIDYLVPGLVSVAFLEIFPFIWSLILAIFRYIGIRKGNKCCYEFSQFFLF